MIRILHITPDDKFFDSVITHFEKDDRLENRSIVIVKSADYKFRYVKSIEKITLLWSKRKIKTLLKTGNYDVIFFHSLPESLYKLFKYIPKEKIIIWWGWGYDIYESFYGIKPLIEIELYKPITRQLISLREKKQNIKVKIKKIIKKYFARYIYNSRRYNLLKRINYFQPVLSIEYELMLKNNGFQAKEFYYLDSKNIGKFDDVSIFSKSAQGYILIGNSSSYTNNHLDVWKYMKQLKLKGRKIIFPLNYGDVQYSNYLKTKVKSEDNELFFLDTFMSSDEYFSLLNGCSYAIFGVMRQQAMGNINYCLRNGIKVFLFQDSLVYKNLKEEGYSVFCIEDIDDESLNTPLSKVEIEKNIELTNQDAERRNQVYERCLSEIEKSV